ncbi:hypothetical protein OsI_32756 [Oryza sativa Indica Group]|uniref:Proline-rich protein n=1 Tax=Oryza sativa subsp. indica TaxID=39946 RepID=A2Z530_ORYSI|nr:hypothetical protein OsI_32756 [Oryza sativa Indica Group]
MAAAGRVLALLAVLMAVAAHGEAASVVVGLAKCGDCTRKNMKAEAAFKGLRVAIKCKNGADGEYETKAAGKLDGAGAFRVPLAADLRGADCVAQLHSAAHNNVACPGQEPSRVMQLSERTFVAVAGKTHYVSPVCASATICEPIKKHFFDHFHHNKPAPAAPSTKPAPKPHPNQPPHPKPTPTPSYGTPSPYHPPARN